MSDDPGFAVYDDIFDPAEMARVLDALEQSRIVRKKAGARHIIRVSAVSVLANDSRLVNIASRLLGSSAFPFRATLFDKSFSTNWLVSWHQDTALPIAKRTDHPGWGPWTLKNGVLHAIAPASALEKVVALRVHLDESTAENGPLRVLPRSHAGGVLDHESIRRLAGTTPQTECTTRIGGVVAMRPLVVHASSKARVDRPRRVIHVEYASSTRLDDDIELAVQ